MNGIKAIETNWKGYRFRSRLEARWAVFFESLGLEWEYEPEGYVAGKTPYLPDFRLKSFHDALFEIKPNLQANIDKEDEFALHYKDGFLVICGNPYPWEYGVFANVTGSDGKGILLPFPSAQFAICNCGRIGLVVSSLEGELNLLVLISTNTKKCCDDGCTFRWQKPREQPISDCVLGKAYRAARGARFEHGEFPVRALRGQ